MIEPSAKIVTEQQMRELSDDEAARIAQQGQQRSCETPGCVHIVFIAPEQNNPPKRCSACREQMRRINQMKSTDKGKPGSKRRKPAHTKQKTQTRHQKKQPSQRNWQSAA